MKRSKLEQKIKVSPATLNEALTTVFQYEINKALEGYTHVHAKLTPYPPEQILVDIVFAGGEEVFTFGFRSIDESSASITKRILLLIKQLGW